MWCVVIVVNVSRKDDVVRRYCSEGSRKDDVVRRNSSTRDSEASIL
jgi:hypothetical protein